MPDSDMDILSQMIKSTALVEKDEKHGRFSVTLCEPKAQDQDQDCEVSISKLPEDAMIIKVDTFRSPDTVFKGSRGECKRADYAIISEEKKCVLYIEMKRTKDKEVEIINQLTGAQCFIRYCQAIGQEFWDKGTFLKDYKNRFVSITHISISKKPSWITRGKLHDSPDKVLKISSPHHIEFNRIACV